MAKYLLKYLTISLVGFFSLPTFAQEGYKIPVTIENTEAEEIYLAYYFGDKQYIKDTAQLSDGKYVFQGEESLPGGMYLVVLPPDNQYFELVIDKEQAFSLTTSAPELAANVKIKGSKENELFYKDIRYLADQRKIANSLNDQIKAAEDGSAKKEGLQTQLKALDQKVTAYREKFVQENPEFLYAKVIQGMKDPVVPTPPPGNTDENFAYWYYRNHYFDHIDLSDDRLLRTPLLHNKVDQYLEKLVLKQPDSLNVAIDFIIDQTRKNDEVFQYFVVNLLNKYAKSEIMGMDAVYVHMVEKYYLSGEAFWVDQDQVDKMAERAYSISPTLLGRKAPNFRVQDSEDNWTHLHGLVADFTVLYFWDYDCGHCKTITPKLLEAYEEYYDKNVQLMTVSINGDVEVWKKKLKEDYKAKHGIHTQDHFRKSGFDGMYDIRSTPRLFLLDKDKNILAKQISVDQLKEMLNRELGIETPESEPSIDEGK